MTEIDELKAMNLKLSKEVEELRQTVGFLIENGERENRLLRDEIRIISGFVKNIDIDRLVEKTKSIIKSKTSDVLDHVHGAGECVFCRGGRKYY